MVNHQVEADRPARPADDLLARAAVTLGDLLGLDEAPRWSVLDRQERRRSTLFVLEARHPAGRTGAYCKVDAVSGVALAMARDSLRVEQQVSGRLAEVLGSHHVRADWLLALDVGSLSAVRLAVPGRPIGRAGYHMMPGRRRDGLKLFGRVGEAMRMVEEVTRTLGPTYDAERFDRRLHAELEQARKGLPARLREPVTLVATDLRAAVDIESAALWGHGDLSSTNVLVDSNWLGLIDFSWTRYLAGESIAYFVARLGAEPRTPAGWKRSVISAVTKGYGVDEVESWRLAYLLRLLRWANKPSTALRQWSHGELLRLVDRAGR